MTTAESQRPADQLPSHPYHINPLGTYSTSRAPLIFQCCLVTNITRGDARRSDPGIVACRGSME
jgi:hypothetical protein